MQIKDKDILLSKIGRFFNAALKVLVIIIFIFPFYWMVSTSLKDLTEALQFPPTLIPSSFHWENYVHVFETVPIARYFLNSVMVSLGVLVLQYFIIVPAAYSLARHEYRGKKLFFGLVLLGQMIPQQITFLPVYFMFSKAKLLGTCSCLMMNAGGSIFNEDYTEIGFNNEAGTAPLYLWKEMIEAGTMHIPSGQDYNSSEACRNAFAGGTAAMIMQSSAQLKGLEQTCEFEVGVTAIPMSTTRAYPAGGSNLMMFSGHSEEEEAAGWEFLKFMTNTENAVKWASGTGYLPTRQSCTANEEYLAMVEEDPNLQIIVDNVEYCAEATFIPEYAETKEIIANEIQKCILEEDYTPEEAMQSTADRVAKLF